MKPSACWSDEFACGATWRLWQL